MAPEMSDKYYINVYIPKTKYKKYLSGSLQSLSTSQMVADPAALSGPQKLYWSNKLQSQLHLWASEADRLEEIDNGKVLCWCVWHEEMFCQRISPRVCPPLWTAASIKLID